MLIKKWIRTKTIICSKQVPRVAYKQVILLQSSSYLLLLSKPKQIFLLKMEPSLDPFFAFFKQFNFYRVDSTIVLPIIKSREAKEVVVAAKLSKKRLQIDQFFCETRLEKQKWTQECGSPIGNVSHWLRIIQVRRRGAWINRNR